MAVATMPSVPHREGASEGERYSLAGDLGAMPLGDLLLWIAVRRKTGTLHLQRRERRKLLVFQDGKLQYGSSNDPREKLGQLLVRRQLISEAQLCSALARQEQTGIQLGVLLVSQGRLRADELCRTLRAKVEAIVYELFLWTDGGFVFKEGALGGVPIQAKLDTRAVVEEGRRRRKRSRRIRESFGGYDVRFDALVDTPAPVDPARARMLELAKAGKSLAEIVTLARQDEFETADYLLALVELRVLAVRPRSA